MMITFKNCRGYDCAISSSSCKCSMTLTECPWRVTRDGTLATASDSVFRGSVYREPQHPFVSYIIAFTVNTIRIVFYLHTQSPFSSWPSTGDLMCLDKPRPMFTSPRFLCTSASLHLWYIGSSYLNNKTSMSRDLDLLKWHDKRSLQVSSRAALHFVQKIRTLKIYALCPTKSGDCESEMDSWKVLVCYTNFPHQDCRSA